MIKNKTCCSKEKYSWLMRISSLILIIAVVCAGTSFAATNDRYIVDIYDGQEITRVEALSDNARAVVKEANIQLSDNDRLIIDDFHAGKQSVIIICRESNVTLVKPNGETKELTFAGTVAELLEKEGITLGKDFVSSVDVNAVVTDKMEIRILNSYGITINADGETRTVSSSALTVKELLNEQKIVLGENDQVTPSLDTALQNGMAVDVLRIQYVERTAAEEIPFGTKTVKSSALKEGTSKITTAGVKGSKTVVYKDKLVNGKVESSEVISEKIDKKPVDQIKTVGTLAPTKTISGLGNTKIEKNGKPISEFALPSKYSIGENNVPTSYRKVITGKAAAYCVPGGKTATGKNVKPGYIAVNPKQIPYGTEMWIVSTDGVVYGYAIAADTGGFAKKGTFTVDLYMNSKEQCCIWGARNVNIYIL